MPHNPNLPQIRGALFENANPNGPAMSGFIEIDGNKFFFSCWPATAQKTGDPYFRLSADDMKNKQNGIQPLAQGPGTGTMHAAPRPMGYNQHPSQQQMPGNSMQRPGYQPQGNPNITTGGPQRMPRQQQQAPRSPDDMEDDIPF